MANKIFWDKGHGGTDPGAVANGLQEKELTHKIVEYAMNYLNANYIGFEQRTSRTGDQTVDLNKRAIPANNWGADVFVSVHINAGGGTGFESFIYNGVVSNATKSLQNMLHAEILSTMHEFGTTPDRGKKRSNFVVLRETNMPAVLTENLFIDTTSDADKLKNEAFLKAVGEAHARGVAKFLNLSEKPKNVQEVPSDKGDVGGYVSGRIYPGEAFVVAIKNTVVNGKWELTELNDWVVAVANTEVLGYKPDPSLYHEGKNLYEVKRYQEGVGWFTRGWVHGNFDYLTERPVGYSQMYNEYKYQLRKTATIYDKNMAYVAKLPAGRYFFTKDTKAHPSAPHLMRVDRNETSTGTFSSIYGDYGWIDTNTSKGTDKNNFGIRFLEE